MDGGVGLKHERPPGMESGRAFVSDGGCWLLLLATHQTVEEPETRSRKKGKSHRSQRMDRDDNNEEHE